MNTQSQNPQIMNNHSRNPRGRRTLKVILLLILLLIIAIAGLVVYSYKSTMDSLDISFDYAVKSLESSSADSLEGGDSNITENESSQDANTENDSSQDKNAEIDSSQAIDANKDAVTDDVLYIDVGTEYPALDAVAASVGDITPAAEYLDTDTVGDRELEFTVSKSLYGGLLTPSKTFTLKYSVVDTEPPLVLWNGSGTVLQRGAEFNINDVFSYGDNADPRPKIKVDGDVDMGKAGSYDMHITITDASGNSTESDLTVSVADAVPTYQDNAARTDFKSFARKNKGKGRSFGIDVSTWQRDIDFEKVKAAGCDFVIIRVGYSDDGTLTEDSYFRKNLKNAKAAGLKVGLYMFSYDNSEEEVRTAARTVIDALGGETLDLPIAFDWEDFGRFNQYEMSLITLNRLYDAFADELATAGYDCMLYGNRNSLDAVWTDTDTRPVWLAHYTDKTDYEGPYIIWQAGNTGRISGIDGDVDLDIMYN